MTEGVKLKAGERAQMFKFSSAVGEEETGCYRRRVFQSGFLKDTGPRPGRIGHLQDKTVDGRSLEVWYVQAWSLGVRMTMSTETRGVGEGEAEKRSHLGSSSG